MSITSVVNDLVTSVSVINALKPLPPTISGYSVAGKDDLALDPAGGQTVQINGTGFLPGATITFDGSAVAVVTYVNPNQLTFTSPAKTAGTYTIYVVNSDGGTAIYVPGIIYSTLPTWTTAAGSLGSYYETTSISNTVVAAGDAPVTYSLYSGSLPTGSTLSANGVITGTAPVDSSSTTYSFTIQASDAQLQDSTRSFSLTINVDAVTWVSPANATTYTSAVDSAISTVTLSATDAAGYAVSYSANALPTGLSLSGANITGTPTVVADSSTLLTATAATTNRTAVRTINWSITVANDVYFEYNTLLIPGASTTFVDDASTNNFAVTINGDTKPNNFNPYTPGYYSGYFDGSGDYLTAPSDAAYQFGTGDFTIEYWIYQTASGSYRTVLDTRASGTASPWACLINSSNQPYILITSDLTSSIAININAWNHVAIVRSGTNLSIYVNGVSGLSTTNSTNISPTGSLRVGFTVDTVYPMIGYLSNIRIVKGTAVYTSAFTPPTTPLTAIANTSLLTCQSNRFIDNSTNNFTITRNGDTTVNSFDPFTPNTSYSTYGSGYFDGTGDYLTCVGTGAVVRASGSFTIEGWYYPTSASASYRAVYSSGSGYTTAGRLYQYGTQLEFYNSGSGSAAVGSIGWTINTWNHFAVTWDGTTTKIYVNGQLSNTNSFAYSGTTDLSVSEATYTALGYVSNFRVVSSVVYTTTFTPPSAPLTAIANTSLLVLQNNQSVNNSVFLDNSSNNFLVTRAGNTTQGTFSPYGGNWSNYFDGSSTAYIQTPAGSTTAIIGGTGAISPTSTFTVECWIYQTQRHTSTTAPCLTGDVGVNGSLYWAFGPDYTGKLAFYHYTGAQVLATGNDTIPLNTWTHIAMSINSGAIKLFVNGNLQTITGATTTGTQNGTFGYLLTGGWYQFGTLAGYYGNLSNLRIVKSALYSTTFTPSTTPLTPITNTGLLMCQSSSFIDNSPNAFALTTGSTLSVQRFSPFNPSSVTATSYSGYFGSANGNSLYLSAQTSGTGGVALSGNYTMEMWLYPTAASGSGYSMLIATNTNGGVLQFYYNSSGNLGYYSPVAGQLTTSSAPLTFNAWQHVALVRSSNVVKVYVNGVEKAFSSTITDSSTVYANYIGGLGTVYNTFGYISNLRVNNTAIYTTTFTPSTTPLTAISGTQLLTLQSATFIDNSTNNYSISVAGSPQPTIQNPFGYTSATTNGYSVSTIGGSVYLDGSGDYLNVPYSTAFNLGTNDFTIDFWVNTTSTVAYATALRLGDTWTTGSWALYLNDSNGNGYPSWWAQVPYTLSTSGAKINDGAWHHIALVRQGSSFVMYIDGISRGTLSNAASVGTSSTQLWIGRDSSNVRELAGYLTDIRIINGTALYTSNFVPPSAPSVAVKNTSLLTNMTNAGIYDAAMMNNMETVGDAKLSTAISKFGGSSMAFDGSGDVLSTAASQNFVFTGDFTVEGWVYIDSTMTSTRPDNLKTFIFMGWNTGNTPQLYVYGNTSTPGIGLGYYDSTSSWEVAVTVPKDQWVHIAYVRTGTILYGFVAGTRYTINASISATIGTNNTMVIAGNPNQVAAYYSYLKGYIDDLRITKGVARYTSNFTAPTTAFPIY